MAKTLTKRVLLLKAGPIANRAGLQQQDITDKNGVVSKRWVKVNKDEPAQQGHHVGFENGEHKGHGEVIGSGKDGVTVRDGKGGEHRVPHAGVTHRWEGDEAPGHGPHGPAKPDYAPRAEGESDKAYAKRVVDKGDKVESLPEDHERYFTGGEHVPMDRLHSSKSDEENAQGGENGPKRMLAAYHGVLSKRAPITVMPHKDKEGHFEVVDGNGTLTSGKQMGWSGLPVEKVSREEGEVRQIEDKVSDLVKSTGVGNLFVKERQGLPEKPKNSFDNWKDLHAAAMEAQPIFADIMDKIGSEIGGKSVDFGKHDFSQPGIIYGVGPVKGADRAAEKVNGKYKGDWSKLSDVVRGSIGFDTHDEMIKGVEALKAKMQEMGIEIASKPDNKFKKPTNAGYSDIGLNFKMPNGVVGELQIHLNGILAAKKEGHKLYEEQRSLEEKIESKGVGEPGADYNGSGDQQVRNRIKELTLAQRKLYGAAKMKALSSGQNLQKSYLAGKLILLMKGK